MLTLVPVSRKDNREAQSDRNLAIISHTSKEEGIFPKRSFPEVRSAFAELTFSAIDMQDLRDAQVKRNGSENSFKKSLEGAVSDSFNAVALISPVIFSFTRSVGSTVATIFLYSIKNPTIWLAKEYNFRKWSNATEKQNKELLATLSKEMELPSHRLPEDIGINLALRAIHDVCPRASEVLNEVSQIDRLKYFRDKVKGSDSPEFEFINYAFTGIGVKRKLRRYEVSKVQTLGAISLYMISGKSKDLKFVRESLSNLHNDTFLLKYFLYPRLSESFPNLQSGIFKLYAENLKLIKDDWING